MAGFALSLVPRSYDVPQAGYAELSGSRRTMDLVCLTELSFLSDQPLE